MTIERLTAGPIGNNIYILMAADGSAAVIDPGFEAGRILAEIKRLNAKVQYVLLTHGHSYGVSMGREGLAEEAKSRGCDVAMFGHTHRPFLETVKGVLLVNPGSLSYPRQEGRQPSYLLLTAQADGTLDFSQNYLRN